MAAGSTYTPIATTTLGSTTASYTFSNISGSYTDLILVCNYGTNSSGEALSLQFNSDTGTNYSGTTLYGSGTAAATQRFTNQTVINLQRSVAPTASAVNSSSIAHIMNYSNSTSYKTIISRANSPVGIYDGIETTANVWRSTSAITSIKVLYLSGGSFTTGTTFTLYGVTAA